MLHGTEITIGDETVSDVLIGEPSEGGRAYTLGIPKGDTHYWLDREVRFFGRRWRTVGVPDEGIEENIPLRWHKKVHVRQLVTSGSVTVWNGSDYSRHVFHDADFSDLRGIKVTSAVVKNEGAVTVMLYSCAETDGYIPRYGDLIVNGEQEFEFDTSTPQTASGSMAAFRQTYPKFAVINGVEANLNGEKYDYTITAG